MDTTMTDANDAPDVSFMLEPEFDELSSDGQAAHLERWQEEYDDETNLQGPLTLSLGVEIECILLQNTSADPSQASLPDEVSRGQEKVHEALSRPMHIACDQCGEKHEYKLRLNSLMRDADEAAQGGRYDAWSVGKDMLEMGFRRDFPEQFKNIRIHYIEVRSRILHVAGGMQAEDRGTKCPHRPQITYRDEIEAIYARLREDFLTPSSDPMKNAWRIFNNKSCGLHVHIGNGGPGRRLPLHTVKNVMNLYLASEKAIDNMHSSTRITGSTLLTDPTFYSAPASPVDQMFDSCMNVPESAHFMYGAYMALHPPESHSDTDTDMEDTDTDGTPDRNNAPSLFFDSNNDEDSKSTTIPAWTRLIARAPTLAHLRVLHHPREKICTLNIDHMRLSTPSSSAKQTIEFRQAAGTLDAVSALAWVEVVLRLVSYAHERSVEEVVGLCEREIWGDEKFCSLDFLAEVGFGGRDREGRKRVNHVDAGDEHGVFEHYRYVLGLQRTGSRAHSSRAKQVYQSDLAIAESYGKDDFFYPIMKKNAERTYKETKPKAVNAKLHEKFMRGCYGQFGKGFLRRLGREKDWRFEGYEARELKGRLVVGWTLGDQIGVAPLEEEEEEIDADADAAEQRGTGGVDGDSDDDEQPSPAKRRRGNNRIGG